MPKTGEHGSQRLGLAFLPDHHVVKEPATASPPTIVTNTHPAYLAQGHGLNEELVVLEDRGREKRVKCAHFSRIKLISRAGWGWPHVALFKFVDIVFAHNHEALPRVSQVTDDIEEDAGVGAAAAHVAGANGDAVLYH